MKRIRKIFIIGLGAFMMSSVFAKNVITKPTSEDKQSQITPRAALTLLKEGNSRFVADARHYYNYVSIRQHNVKGQHPLAIVLSCIDSRSIPDVVFDQAPGNLFVTRIAGNVVSTDVLGSMEFATKHAGAKCVVVMGHTACGAMQGACQGGAKDNLKVLLNSIKPAVAQFRKQKNGQQICDSAENLNAIAKINVNDQMNKILKNSPTLHQLVKQKKIILVGAMHDLGTGKVTFFSE